MGDTMADHAYGQTPSVKPAELHTGCKINLFLDVLDRLENGYHTLRTLLIPLSDPSDTLICLPQERGITVRCTTPGIDPAENTLTKAYALYAEAGAFSPGLSIELRKGIPHSAGLGGGSADAAALLLYLQQCAGPSALSGGALSVVAAQVGADVPFFLRNKPALGQGIGEKLTPLAWNELPVNGLSLVLVCPNIRVSTDWAYAAWDKAQTTLTAPARKGTRAFRAPLITPGFAPGLTSGAKPDTDFSWLRNSLEPMVFAAHPELADLRARFLQRGAAAALMSGSGASVFGLFRSRGTALEAAKDFAYEGERVFMHDFPVHRPETTTGVSPSW